MTAASPEPVHRRRLVVLAVLAAALLVLVVVLWGRQTASALLGVAAVLALVVGVVRAVRRRGWRWLGTAAVALVLATGLAPTGTDAAEADLEPGPSTSASAPRPADQPTPTPEPDTEATPATDDPSRSPGVDPTAAGNATATDTLALLAVKGRSARTGYDRDAFGWNSYDFDRNGCDQRNDTLARDMTEEEIRPGSNGCYVLAGVLQDRYAGTATWAERSEVDIDHAVALSNAWQTGAAGWDGDTLVAFANDPLNLVATDASLNRQKGDGDAATWLPPARDLRCDYVARQIAVKHAYQLWVTPPEHDAMERILGGCPEQQLPEPGAAPEPMTETVAPRPDSPIDSDPEPTTEPEVAPEPTAEPEPSSADVYYQNCDAVRAAGADPIHAGEPGYDTHLDRDGDGVGCER